jgi:uncharacterized protein
MANNVSGIDPGQRRLNGTQTTGRDYRQLSTPEYEMTHTYDVEAPMRDGVSLLADVYRPTTDGKFPVLLAASPYPRQIQNSGAPMGFIEAGASDFWVPRGYVHVIANLRGTGGSGGTFGFMDGQERQDLHDLVEWAAAQPWSNGNVGMLGISYFASTQIEAATQQPEHLKAIFAFEATTDLYQSAVHHGLMSASFVTTFLAMIGMTSGKTNKLWRSHLVNGISDLLRTPHIHRRFATSQGDAAMAGLRMLLKLHHDPHPWDDLWREIAVEHPVRDAWWEDRSMVPLFDQIQVPAYVGCDWENVPLHLPGSLSVIEALLETNPNVRVAMLGDLGISWPWETMHIEALAWFDQWLKGRDTGILQGPRVRYQLRKGEADGWRASESWPIPGVGHTELALRADGGLSTDEGDSGQRTYMVLGAGLNRARPSEADPPSSLAWETKVMTSDLDLLGDIELRLDATASAADTAWIVTLQDVAPDATGADITSGYLRASLRSIDEDASRPGRPILSCTTPELVPVNQEVSYRVPIVGTGYRIAAGHRLRLVLTSDDQDTNYPAMMTFRHASVGTSSLNRISSTSRLLLPVASGGTQLGS